MLWQRPRPRKPETTWTGFSLFIIHSQVMADVRTADPRFTPAVRVSSVRFLTFTSEEVKKLSCKRITNPTSFDGLLHPTLGGLYDPALGPSDKHELCGTCGLNYVHCPGHMGHITLPLPVFHPIFFTTLYRILQTSCLSCHHFLTTKYKCNLLKAQMRLLDHGLVSDALELECHFKNGIKEGRNTADTVSYDDMVQYVDECIQKNEQHIDGGQPTLEKSKHLTDLRLSLVQDFFRVAKLTKCTHCQAPSRKIRHEYQNKVMIRGLSAKQAGAWVASANRERMKLEGLKTEKDMVGTVSIMNSNKITPERCMEQHYLSPLDACEHLHLMWGNDPLLMMAVFSSFNEHNEHQNDVEKEGTCPTDMFFVDTIPVPPSKFRPVSSIMHYLIVAMVTVNTSICFYRYLHLEPKNLKTVRQLIFKKYSKIVLIFRKYLLRDETLLNLNQTKNQNWFVN